MKSTGIVLTIVAIIIFAVDSILERKQKENLKTNVKTILFLIAIITMVLLSWKCKTMIGGANEKWEMNKITISNVSNVLSGNGEYYQRVTIKNFIDRSFLESGTLTSRGMNALNLLMFITGFDILVYIQIKDKDLRKRFVAVSIILLVSWVIYGFSLLLIYIFIFTSSEAMILACYERYMLTIPLAISFINIALMINLYKDSKIKLSNAILIFAIILIFMPIKNIEDIYVNKRENIEETVAYREQYKGILKYSEKLSLDDKVYYISNFQNEREILIVTYEFLPLKIANRNQKLTMGRDQFLNILIDEGYTHIYVNKTDRVLEKQYIDLFIEGELQEKTMYEIVIQEGEISFKKM